MTTQNKPDELEDKTVTAEPSPQPGPAVTTGVKGRVLIGQVAAAGGACTTNTTTLAQDQIATCNRGLTILDARAGAFTAAIERLELIAALAEQLPCHLFVGKHALRDQISGIVRPALAAERDHLAGLESTRSSVCCAA